MSAERAAAADLLLVCLDDPFEAVGDSSLIVRVTVPLANGSAGPLWVLETALEMNPPRTFRGWASRSGFTVDLKVNATVFPADSGTWGGTADTTSGTGNCRVGIRPGPNNKVLFSAESGSSHATERPLPEPEERRFLNADMAFAADRDGNLTAGAAAVISNLAWDALTDGTEAAQTGLYFDHPWRHHLGITDGYAAVPAKWKFAVMTADDYSKLCDTRGWLPYILD